jgi:cardiolipin synthase
MSWLLVYIAVGWAIRLGMVPTVLRRQMAPGASVAWLGIVFLHPYIGVVLYGLVGESRLGPRRAARSQQIIARIRDPQRHPGVMQHRADPDHGPSYQPMVQQAEKISDMPVLGSNSVDFFDDTKAFVDKLVADIAAAQQTVHLLYYIFFDDETGRRVAEAVIDAARRGVKCRVIADAVASRRFFSISGLAPRLISGGVEVAAALPIAPFRRAFARMDLRNHRKLAIIDGQIAFAGSHNLINADYGGRRGNPWFDLTGRLRGPIVGELALVFAEDWEFETGKELDIQPLEPTPDAKVLAQAVPTGPSNPDTTYRRLLLAAIQCSRKELILTTPYFVPDEPTLLALSMAADRGVDVKLILPQVPDHIFTAAAGRAHFETLLRSGVGIYLYQPGLIHAKTATVDDAFCVFGSANLDVRSFNLNFELSICLYGDEITNRLRDVQESYLAHSKRLESETWGRRGTLKVYTDRAITLLSPLL